jgi:hypothetical protein
MELRVYFLGLKFEIFEYSKTARIIISFFNFPGLKSWAKIEILG